MKTFATFASISLLFFGSAAMAQDVQGPMDNGTPVEAAPAGEAMTVPVAPAEDATMHQDHSGMNHATPDADAATPDDTDVMAQTQAQPQTFTDEEIASFAAAALQIQSLQGESAGTQDQAASIVASSGLDAETFNAIGTAMRSDPALAERVQLAAAAIRGEADPDV